MRTISFVAAALFVLATGAAPAGEADSLHATAEIPTGTLSACRPSGQTQVRDALCRGDLVSPYAEPDGRR